MRLVWILLVGLLLTSCSGDKNSGRDPIAVAFQELKDEGDADSFLIILNDDDQQYIQFKIANGAIIFDRPILAGSQPNLPKVSARYYKAVKARPVIEGEELYRFLSTSEAALTEKYFAKWSLATEPILTASEDEDGRIVEYFESFHGAFSIPESRFREFLVGYFSEVFGIVPEKQSLTMKTEEAQQVGDGDAEEAF